MCINENILAVGFKNNHIATLDISKIIPEFVG